MKRRLLGADIPEPQDPGPGREYLAELGDTTQHAFDLLLTPETLVDFKLYPIDDVDTEYYYRQAQIILSLVSQVNRSHDLLVQDFYRTRRGLPLNDEQRLIAVELPDFAELFMYYVRFSNAEALRALVAHPSVWEREEVRLTFTSTRLRDVMRVAGRYADKETTEALWDVVLPIVEAMPGKIPIFDSMFLFLEEAWQHLERFAVADHFLKLLEVIDHVYASKYTYFSQTAQRAVHKSQSVDVFRALHQRGFFQPDRERGSGQASLTFREIIPSTFVLERFLEAGLAQEDKLDWWYSLHWSSVLEARDFVALIENHPQVAEMIAGKGWLPDWRIRSEHILSDRLGEAVLRFLRVHYTEEQVRPWFRVWGIESLRVDFLFAHDLMTDAEFAVNHRFQLVFDSVYHERMREQTFSWKGIMDFLRRVIAINDVTLNVLGHIIEHVRHLDVLLEQTHWEELLGILRSHRALEKNSLLVLWMLSLSEVQMKTPRALVPVLAQHLEQCRVDEHYAWSAGYNNASLILWAWQALVLYLPSVREETLRTAWKEPISSAFHYFMSPWTDRPQGVEFFTFYCSLRLLKKLAVRGFAGLGDAQLERMVRQKLVERARAQYEQHNGPRERAALVYFDRSLKELSKQAV